MNKPLLCDANIFIDYMNASPTLLYRISPFHGGLFVPDIVYAEGTLLKETDPSEVGIILLETPFEEIETVVGFVHSGLLLFVLRPKGLLLCYK